MRKLIEKTDWDKFRIRSKKDWAIFWVFAALICYAAGVWYGSRMERWLFQFANPYMSELNQPHTWGQLMGFLLLFAVVTEAVLFLCKKPVKIKILVLAGALLMPAALVGGYRVHTNLIVSSLWEEEPGSIYVRYYEEGQGSLLQSRDIPLTEEQALELLELCRNMTVVSDEEMQEQLRQWYRERSDDRTYSVQMHFRERYGHHYSCWLKVDDGKIFLHRGYSSEGQEITFFEDNGIVEWLEETRAAAE